MTDAALASHHIASIEEQAANWVVMLDDEVVDASTRAACDRWCAQDPRHAQALEAMRRMWQAVNPDTPLPRTNALQKPTVRRVAGLLVVLPCAIWIAQSLPWRYWLADERTAVGETRELTLADGSHITLNSDSAVDVDLRDGKRRVRLRRGEVYVEVAQGAAPFAVIDRDGAAVALGTRYAVRRDEHDTLVTVDESRVQLRPREARDAGVVVAAGQQARFDRQGVTMPVADAAPGALAWRQGRLVFQDVPAREVLRELARYRPGVLLIDDEALEGLRFTGVLPTTQSDQALALLASALPLRISRVSPWLVRVTASDSSSRSPTVR
ncbi:FecR family protein [Variovorax sp. Sphag1AA]|uniref:FecR family protein n=1 Tax=Variovorax sp. Sphag1AA TaxID=2587027 RepID=UPI00161FAB6C|nr:FecR family protein [Variovorax sp. Sphag1AA]MBB3181769.1 transmembrane sensor [Variovorax sp. Sphag1AA]